MKTKILISFFFFIVGNSVVAQQVYVDPTTTFALRYYSKNLKIQQKKTIEEQSKLKKAQVFVSLQMKKANEIQNKIYKGLREVSGTLQNAIQVKNIYSDIKDCHKYATKIKNLVAQKPQYAVFGVKASQKSYEQLLKIGSELSGLLKSSDTNLATAGDRYKILFKIENEVQTLKMWLIATSINLERAIRIGFWRSINPFQGYINTDRDIVENIMYKFKHQI